MKYSLACILLLTVVCCARGLSAEESKPIAVVKLDRADKIDFEKEILPLFNASCLACHNKTKPKGGLVLETPADIRKGGDGGAAVVPGKPAESLLLKAAARLQAVRDAWGQDSGQVDEALLYNRKLWSFFLVSVT